MFLKRLFKTKKVQESVDRRTIIIKGYKDNDYLCENPILLISINLPDHTTQSSRIFKEIKKIRDKKPYDMVTLSNEYGESYWGASSCYNEIVISLLIGISGNLITKILEWAYRKFKKGGNETVNKQKIRNKIKDIIMENVKSKKIVIQNNIKYCYVDKRKYIIQTKKQGNIIILKNENLKIGSNSKIS